MSRFLIAFCLASFSLLGCTPRHDWRAVQSEEYRWSAMFPAKPVEVSRTVSIGGLDHAVKLTLRSAKIGDTMFAVGWVAHQSNAEKDAAKTAEKIRAALEAAMLKNINHDPASLKAKTIPQSAPTQNGQAIRQISAAGKMRIDSLAAPADARLWMRSIAMPHAGLAAIEIIAIGPADELTEELALQFIESLRIRN